MVKELPCGANKKVAFRLRNLARDTDSFSLSMYVSRLLIRSSSCRYLRSDWESAQLVWVIWLKTYDITSRIATLVSDLK